jgi:hypothetical protein
LFLALGKAKPEKSIAMCSRPKLFPARLNPPRSRNWGTSLRLLALLLIRLRSLRIRAPLLEVAVPAVGLRTSLPANDQRLPARRAMCGPFHGVPSTRRRSRNCSNDRGTSYSQREPHLPRNVLDSAHPAFRLAPVVGIPPGHPRLIAPRHTVC